MIRIVFEGLVVATLLFFLPGYRWDVLEAVTELVFMLAIFSAVKKLDESIKAYEFVSKRAGRALTRGID